MNELLNIDKVENKTTELAQQILDSDDQSQIKDLTALFNMNQAKKNVLRVLKLNELLDKISDQMLVRFDKRADEFSNADLVNYMNTVQSAIEKANKSLDLVNETPLININQTSVELNLNGESLTRESRAKINEVVQQLLSKAKNVGVIDDEDIVNTTSTEIINEEENDSNGN